MFLRHRACGVVGVKWKLLTCHDVRDANQSLTVVVPAKPLTGPSINESARFFPKLQFVGTTKK
eukprot:m.76633 g.76633  ORF g.76633 m.76633 type:complete len:63 (-) comp24920_c0_seq1:1148-1336(-)